MPWSASTAVRWVRYGITRFPPGLSASASRSGLRAVGGRPAFYEADSLLRETIPYYFIPESAWDETSRLQRELADRGWHQRVSPADLLMAVTARHHKLTVLHADADFDAISRLTGQPVRWIS
ncbi:PIN domain-containing protein [Microtetraspora malaysiensis]|uniref:PIN domain-containing protein n=1 Tax=Microtetraspora malaysiensis TaxID=161358 RepID=A0ABW6T043_9ACTN